MKIRLLFFIFLMPMFLLSCGGDDDPIIDNGSGNGNGNGGEGTDPNENLPLLKTLKIMTYNIHSCNPPSKAGVADVDAVAQAIKAANADIVFLQEVDKNTGRNNNYDDQAAEIGKKAGLNAQFFSARAQGKGFYGVAILSKYKIVETKAYLLPRKGILEQRVMGTAVIELTGKEQIMAAATHLQHNDADNRLDQIKEIVKVLKDEPLPVVLGGDFNEKTTAVDFFEVFDNAFTRTCLGFDCPNTFPATNPSSMIDFLAFKPATAFTVSSHITINETYASDHLPVVSVLTFKR